MKKFILGCFFFCISQLAQAQISIQELDKIYKTIIIKNGLIQPVSKSIINSNIIQAMVTKGNHLFITVGLLKYLSKPELAFVLSHELAHIKFKDPYHKQIGTQQEDRADKYGSQYAKKAGYSECQQALFFIRLYRLYGNQGGLNDTHSSNLKRFWNIYKGCNK
jgi:predicted Zn-dependent protease